MALKGHKCEILITEECVGDSMAKNVSKFVQAARMESLEKNLRRMKKAADVRNVDFDYSIGPLVTQEITMGEYDEMWDTNEGYKWLPLKNLEAKQRDDTQVFSEKQWVQLRDMLQSEKKSWRNKKHPNFSFTTETLPEELKGMLNADGWLPHSCKSRYTLTTDNKGNMTYVRNENPLDSYDFGTLSAVGLKNQRGFRRILNLKEWRESQAEHPNDKSKWVEPIYSKEYIFQATETKYRVGHVVNINYGDFADSTWEVLAVLDPLLSMYFGKKEEPYLIKKMPHLTEDGSDEEDVHELLPTEIDSLCEHCNTRRERKKLVAVRDKETGEIRRVGTNCLFEYTDIQPELILKLYQTLETPMFGNPDYRYALEQYDLYDFIVRAHRVFGFNGIYQKKMGWTLYEIKNGFQSPVVGEEWVQEEGWAKPQLQYQFNRELSFFGRWVWDKKTKPLSDFSEYNLRKHGMESLPLTPEVEEVASEIISYCANLEGKSDFERNLKAIAEHGVVSKKNSGMAASMWFVWNKAKEDGRLEAMFGTPTQEEVDEDVVPDMSIHIGEIGERIEFTSVLMRKSSREGMWGTTHMMVFQTVESDDSIYPAGCEVVWWASTKKQLPNVGDVVRVRGTVKKHGEFKDVQNTTIGRGHLTILDEWDES